jgi:hypothetical protein
MCSVSCIDEDLSKTLMQLLSNMTRANELDNETDKEIDQMEANIGRFKKGVSS